MAVSVQIEEMSTRLTLMVYYFILVFQAICACINSFILYLFLTKKELRKNPHMRLVLFLSLGDFLLAVGGLPYIIYMIINWNPIQIDFDPLYIMISAQPLPMQLKISATITVGIALGRIIALFFPSTYRRMNQSRYSNVSICISLLIASTDVFLYWFTSKIERHLNCGSIGCFLSNSFLYYWGASKMILGLITVVLSIALFCKLRLMSKETLPADSQLATNKYSKANRTTTGILVSSLLFLTIPSVGVGIGELIGLSLFKSIGPFYIASLLVNGCCHGIIFIASNWKNVKPRSKVSSTVLKISTGQWQ